MSDTLQLRSMDEQMKVTWVALQAECALVRAGQRRIVASDLDIELLGKNGVQDVPGFLDRVNEGKDDRLSDDLRALLEAEDVLACMAVANAGIEVDKAARLVTAMEPKERAAVILAQDGLNDMQTIAMLVPQMLAGEFLRRLVGVTANA